MRRKRSGQFEYTFWGKGTAGRCDFGRTRKIERLPPFHRIRFVKTLLRFRRFLKKNVSDLNS